MKANDIFFALLLCCVGGITCEVHGQIPSSKILQSVVKETVGGGKTERKVVSKNSFYLRWKIRMRSTEIYIDRYESPSVAKERYVEIAALIDESLNGRGRKGAVDGLGDEALLWTQVGFAGEATINFVRGSFRVAINGSSAEDVRSLAKKIDKLLLDQLSQKASDAFL